MSNANRVAFNTAINYIQVLLNVAIGLFTVRLLFGALGVVDYGVYNLLAGVITIMTFISESLSQTSIRFISITIGQKGDVRSVFSTCFSLHLYLGLALVFILEIISLFLFDGVLNIPESRVYAAQFVFHFMVFTIFLNIITTPLKAIIIANEQLYLNSYISILEAIFKLIIAFAVTVVLIDKLILYGGLLFALALLVFIIYLYVVLRRFKNDISFKPRSFKSIKYLLSFASWTILDVLGVVCNRQGYAIMLNKFIGPSANSVYALASQMEGPLFSTSASIINSIKPQILKSYGAGDVFRSIKLAMTAGKMGFAMMSLIALPILVMLPTVLEIWLGEYPEQTVFYARMMIIACLANQLTLGLTTLNQAVGKLKLFSIVITSIRLFALPVSIFTLIAGMSPNLPIAIFMCCETMASLSRIFVMHKIIDLQIFAFLCEVILRMVPGIVVTVIVTNLVYNANPAFWGVIAAFIVSIVVNALIIYFVGFNSSERSSVKHVVHSLLTRLGYKK